MERITNKVIPWRILLRIDCTTTYLLMKLELAQVYRIFFLNTGILAVKNALSLNLINIFDGFYRMIQPFLGDRMILLLL